MMASIGSKRDISKMEEEKFGGVHCVPVNVSPTRESRNTKGGVYFVANLSDGKRCARVASFGTAHRVVMQKAEEEESVVVLSSRENELSEFRARGSFEQTL